MGPAVIRVVLAVVLVAVAGPAAAVQGVWAEGFHTTGPDGDVSCLLRWNDDVFVGGAFTAIGPMSTPCPVARFRDGAWEPVGHAIEAYRVTDMTVHDGALHVLGLVSGGRRVWRLDGEAWTPVGPPSPGDDEVLASHQGQLFVGPYRLEDGAWVDRLQTDGRIEALTVHDGLLVAGGEFTNAAGIATGHVCAWDGSAVVDAHPGQEDDVGDLEVFGGELYASRESGLGPITAVQVWRDGAWVDVPELGNVTFTDVISDLAPGDGRLLVTRYSFQIIIQSAATRGSSLTAWDGVTATTLYTPPSNKRFLAAAEADDGAWLAGAFILDDGAATANLGLVRAGILEAACAPGLGASGTVSHLERGPDGLAVGGGFWIIGRVASRGVALYDGEWESWGLEHWPGDPDWYLNPLELAWNGPYLMTYAQGHAGHGVGRWLAGSWTFGDWVDQTPSDLIGWAGDLLGPSGDALYAYETMGNPVPVATIAGSGRALFVDDGDLLLGGDFTAVGGVAAQNVARRDGGGWSPLGAGLPEMVIALGCYDGQLVAVMRGPGGDFEINDLMAWNGSSWDFVARLTGGRVTAVQEYAGCLFLGGYVDMPDADGDAMRGLACWTGDAWQSVGEAYPTQALAVYDDKLWVGGSFRHAGGIPASRLCYFSDDLTGAPTDEATPAAVVLAAPAPNPFNPRTTIHFALPRAAAVTLEAFDAAGRRVATVLDAPRSAGLHAVTWQGTGEDGRALPSGTYLLRLTAGATVATTKATLVR